MLGGPSIFAGAPSNEKEQKCSSPFNIKAAQWLVWVTVHFRNFFFFLPREAFFFFFFLRFFFRNLPPLLLFGDLFFAASSSLPRLVLSSRLVNVLPSMVLVLPCCVLCIPKMFWFALLLLDLCFVYCYVYLSVCHASSLSTCFFLFYWNTRMAFFKKMFFFYWNSHTDCQSICLLKKWFSFTEIVIRIDNPYDFFK